MGDAFSLGLSIFAAFGVAQNCSTAINQNPQYSIKEEYNFSSERKERIEALFDNVSFINDHKNDDTIINNSEYVFTMNSYKNRLSVYKDLFRDFDDNIEALLEMFYEDNKDCFFDEFLKYIFIVDDVFVSKSFLSLILESDINIFNSSIKDALQLCTQSKSKSLARKANSMLKYYFKSGI